ncbi:cupin domain-containing protein [Patescibacteria group bacterium]|nr:cupin domain-containing protein [Patescibacteria group bacterium]
MFSKKNLQNIKVEGTSHASGSRKMIVAKEEITSKYFEAHTYGYLPSGVKWEMHEHDNTVEICVVTKGKGTVRDSQGNEEAFIPGDRFIFPSNTKHEIENNSDEEAEFYFFRFKDQ